MSKTTQLGEAQLTQSPEDIVTVELIQPDDMPPIVRIGWPLQRPHRGYVRAPVGRRGPNAVSRSIMRVTKASISAYSTYTLQSELPLVCTRSSASRSSMASVRETDTCADTLGSLCPGGITIRISTSHPRKFYASHKREPVHHLLVRECASGPLAVPRRHLTVIGPARFSDTAAVIVRLFSEAHITLARGGGGDHAGRQGIQDSRRLPLVGPQTRR